MGEVMERGWWRVEKKEIEEGRREMGRQKRRKCMMAGRREGGGGYG